MPVNNQLRTKMQLTFSTKVTEDAYVGITMAGLTLNQNSSTLGSSLDTSWNRGNVPENQLIDNGDSIIAYVGLTWTAGLSGSYIRFWTPQNESFPQTASASALPINGEPYESGGRIKIPVNLSILAGATYNLPAGSSWRVFTLDDPLDDLSFGGATFTGPSLALDQIIIPQPQIALKNTFNGYAGGIERDGATFSNVEWANYTSSSNQPPEISLFWEDGLGASNSWLDYNPHYFLFYYRGRKKKGKNSGVSRGKVPGGFMHPASVPGPIPNPSLTGPTGNGVLRGYPSSIDNRDLIGLYKSGWRTTEWPVGLTSGNPTRIDDGTEASYNAFHPNQYLDNNNCNGVLSLPTVPGGDFLNLRYNSSIPSVGNGLTLFQKHMYFKFAIGIFYDSPSGIRKVIFGPMSETLRITPRAKNYGIELTGYTQQKYIINWQARIV